MTSKSSTQIIWSSVQRIWKKIPAVRQSISGRISIFVFLLLVYFWRRCICNEAKREVEDPRPRAIPDKLTLKDVADKKKGKTGGEKEWGQFCNLATVIYDESPKNQANEEASCRCVCICHASHHEMCKLVHVSHRTEETVQFDRFVLENSFCMSM